MISHIFNNDIYYYVSSFVMIIITLLYYTKVLNYVPCDVSFNEQLYRTFIHIDMFHLLINLYAYNTLITKLNSYMSHGNIFGLLIMIIVIDWIIGYLYNYYYDSACSIGFSGILFGLLAWDYLYHDDFNSNTIIMILISSIYPSLNNAKSSLSGHIIGSLSGLIAFLLSKSFGK